jgi:hypothetical protein
MTDTFRKVYKELDPASSFLIVQIKETAEKMEGLMQNVKSREMSLALTKLEETTMWATKAIVLADAKDPA